MSTVINGHALVDGFGLDFSLHHDGQRWNVAVTAQGGIANEAKTADASPWTTLTELLDEAIAETCRKFPSRRRVTR